VRIDLHTHSKRSDGTSSPRELVHEAAAAGLDVVALTDHDTASGWDEAVRTGHEVGVTVVPGIEVSCRHDDHSVHLLAYLPDPTYEPLKEQLAAILEGRTGRTPKIVARLHELGYDVDEAAVARHARGAEAVGRPHVADALVEIGAFKNRDEAFDELLSWGRPAHFPRYAPPLREMVAVVCAAGGVPVVAHPWGRHGSSALGAEVVAELVELGLAGLEVDHQDHDEEQRTQLRRIARDLGLVVTGSSDYHGTGKIDHDLGCNTTAPEELDRLLLAAEDRARASGRETPTVEWSLPDR
jgi:predicted metal-dependent phosphoesterase TrpH